jgi:ribosomal protein L9
MKVTLVRDARIKHKAGETVEVTPAEANYLLSVGSAVMPEPEKKKTAKK